MRRRTLRGLLAAAGAAALLAAAPAGHGRAATIEGVTFVQRVSAHGTPLALHRAALLSRFFIKGYVAALYLGPGATPETVLRDVPKRLEIEYLRDFRAEQFAEATRQFVARNVDAATYARLRPKIERLNGLYRDVKAGDRYALTYVPGWGCELALNGEALGRIQGEDFQAAVFSIWLGPDPVSEDLRRDLLGTPS